MYTLFCLRHQLPVLLALAFFAAGCGKTGEDKTLDLRFMAAEQSGSWYSLAVGITELMKKEMPQLGNVSIIPGGGISNVFGIETGQAQIGFSQASSIVDAQKGNAPFKSNSENVRYILSLFPHKTHVIVLEDSGIRGIDDLKGKRINVGTKGLLTEDIARRLLAAYGMSYKDMGSVQNLSFSDSVVQMKDGRLDALFWTVPTPFAVLTDLSQSEDIKILSLPDEKIRLLTKDNVGLTRSVIEAGTYRGINQDVATIQSPLVMIANAQTSDEVVYHATKVVYENLESLRQISPNLQGVKKENLYHDLEVPVHAGASRYFLEAGVNN